VFGHRYDPRRPLSLALRLDLDEPYVGWTRRLSQVLLRLQMGYDKPRKITYLLSAGILAVDGTKLFAVARSDTRLGANSGWRLSSDAFTPEQLPAPDELTWEHFLPLTLAGSRAHESVRELCQQ